MHDDTGSFRHCDGHLAVGVTDFGIEENDVVSQPDSSAMSVTVEQSRRVGPKPRQSPILEGHETSSAQTGGA